MTLRRHVLCLLYINPASLVHGNQRKGQGGYKSSIVVGLIEDLLLELNFNSGSNKKEEERTVEGQIVCLCECPKMAKLNLRRSFLRMFRDNGAMNHSCAVCA